MLQIPQIWLGTETALVALLQKLEENRHPPENWYRARMSELNPVRHGFEAGDEDDDLPLEELMAEELIERYDSVGVISIDGHLVNAESPFLSWFGAVGYPTIARAVNRLLDDEEISDIVLSLSTGGGEADGISDLGDSIREADKIKPVYAWTGSNALSAGYWIAASARNVYSTRMGKTGSIGAVATLKVMHRMLKEMGIDVHVARSAPKKALPSPYEPLTKEGEEQLNKEVMALHGFFTEYIASQRPALSQANSEGWANGETFFGEEALSLGLVDAPLQSINSLISELNEAHNRQLDGDPTMPKHVVLSSETDRTLLAAGLAVTQGPAAAQGDTDPSADVQPEADPSLTGEEGSVDPVPVSGGGGQDQPPVQAAAGEGNQVVTFLQEREQELRTENGKLREQMVELQGQLAQAETDLAQLETLRKPMQQAVERLQVALGHRPMSVEEMPPKVLADMYDRLYGELMALPVGRQSVPADPQVNDSGPRDQEGEVSSLVASRLSIVPKR